jgi:hypothetical protein
LQSSATNDKIGQRWRILSPTHGHAFSKPKCGPCDARFEPRENWTLEALMPKKNIYITYLKHRRYSATIFVPHILCGCFFLKAVLGRIKQKTLCQNCAKTRVGARLEDLAAGVICSQNKLEHIFFRAIWYPGLICQGSGRLIFRVFTFS